MHSITVHFSPAGVVATSGSDDDGVSAAESGESMAAREDPIEKIWRAIDTINVTMGSIQSDSRAAAFATKSAIDSINAKLKEHDIWFDKLVWNRDTRSKKPY